MPLFRAGDMTRYRHNPNAGANVQADSASDQGPSPAHNPNIRHLSVTQMQKELRKAGYNLAVDGVSGPMTKSAWAAFHHGLGAKRWNARYAQVEDAHSTNTQANANNQRIGKGVQPRQSRPGRLW